MDKVKLEYIEKIEYTKDGEAKHFYKAHLDSGSRKAVFFSETLKAELEKLKGQQVEMEFAPPTKQGGDPSIKKVPGVWEGSRGGGGGSRPLVTDEQMDKLVRSLDNIADAIRSFGSAAPASVVPLQVVPSSTTVTESVDRQELLRSLKIARESAFGSDRLFESWLTPVLKGLKAEATEDLSDDQLRELIGQVQKIGEARNNHPSMAGS